MGGSALAVCDVPLAAPFPFVRLPPVTASDVLMDNWGTPVPDMAEDGEASGEDVILFWIRLSRTSAFALLCDELGFRIPNSLDLRPRRLFWRLCPNFNGPRFAVSGSRVATLMGTGAECCGFADETGWPTGGCLGIKLDDR